MKPRLRNVLRRIDGRNRWLLAAFALLVLALLRPSAPMQQDVLNSIFIIDISQSMNTRDYQLNDKPVSRLQVVKDTLRQSLSAMPCGSRIGLAIFAEYRSFLLLSPIEVCNNYAELSSSIDRISGRMSWAGGSEVAKGLNWGLKMAVQTQPRPTIVFLTDGHEAPPISFRNRPRIDVKPGEVRGILIGVGNDELTPIPKVDPEGNALGYWQANEVAQVDIYSQGRSGSVSGEAMVDTEQSGANAKKRSATEHLSSVKEAYLQQLAQENGLGYARLILPVDFINLLSARSIAQREMIPTPIGWLPALLALISVLIMYLWRHR